MRPYTWLVPYMRTDRYKAILNAYIEQQLEPPHSFIFSDSSTVGSHLLKNEDYLLMVTRDMLWHEDAESQPLFVPLKTTEPAVERHACLLFRKDLPLSPIAENFRDKLIAATQHLRD